MIFTSPKNFKRGMLIGNRYRFVDLLLAIISISVTMLGIIFYLTINKENISYLIIVILSLPAFFAMCLLVKIEPYHNFLTLCQLLFINYKNKQKWTWEGICRYDEEKE